MFSEINEKLVEIHGELRKKTKYRIQLADYEQELEMIEQTISRLQRELELEQKDVTKLESVTLANILASLAGTKNRKLSQEKEEVILAQHKLHEAEKTKKEINHAMVEICSKLNNLENIEKEYQKLLLQKEEMIKNSTTPFSVKMIELSEQEGVIQSNVTELTEAIDAGNHVKTVLKDAMHSLEKAGGWGTLDLLGGGLLSDLMKHQHIDHAENTIHQAQTCMRQFQKELVDVREEAHLEIDISGMLKFADFFFDGLVADFMVQSKINDASYQVQNQYDKVKDILTNLSQLYNENKEKLESVQKEKQEIIDSM